MTREELERKLGQLAYQVGKQQQLVNRETTKLRDLQNKANDVATEIEKLDGERDNT